MSKKSPRQLEQEIEAALGTRDLHRYKDRPHRGRHVAHQKLGRRWHGSEFQSLLFDKQWTVPEAKVWAAEHGYKATDVDVKENYIHLRQFDPIEGTEKRTIELGQGIKAVLEQVKAK